MGDKMKAAISIMVGLAALVSITLGAHAYFAKQAEFEQLAFRLDQKIDYDQRFEYQKRLWMLKDRYGTDDCMLMPQPDRDTCRFLKEEMRKIDEKYKK